MNQVSDISMRSLLMATDAYVKEDKRDSPLKAPIHAALKAFMKVQKEERNEPG